MILEKDMYENTCKFYIPEGMHNTENLYIKNGIIYKLFSDNSFISEKERNLNFIIKNQIPNTPVVYEKIYGENELLGYTMQYIPKAITFREGIKENISLEDKKNAIIDIYDSMKYLHSNNIFLGDIHSDNMLITNDGRGILIDLEELRFPGDEFKFKQCYLVKPNNNSYRINIPDVYTDNVKLMISSLSLLLNQDLEKYITKSSYDINLETIYNEVILPLNDSKLNGYFIELMNGNNVEYFSNYYFSKNNNIKKKK